MAHAAHCTDCGWTGTPTRPAFAERAAQQHSCDRERWRQAMAARVAARRADSGPVRDCQHPRARHQHGTRNAYVCDQCRCRPCRDAQAAYQRHTDRLRAYGRWQPYVDATPARQHVRALMASGMGWQRIARASGLSAGVMQRLLYGVGGRPPSRRIRPETETALLAVRLDLAPGRAVDGTGTRRRLQALVAVGWSQTSLAARLGWGDGNFSRLIDGGRDVQVRTAQAVRALYDELWDVPPPRGTRGERQAATRARNHASARGWAVPAAWDDIDDPGAVPDPGAPARRDLVEDVDWLLSQEDWTRHGLPARLGVAWSSIDDACRRAGRRDLLDRIRRNSERSAA